MKRKSPPTHISGTNKGEETVRRKGREPGREENGETGSGYGYRSARDATSIAASSRDPIDPRMPRIPPA